MRESKAEITRRLDREGIGDEARAFREEVRSKLRAEGKSRKESSELAWEALAERFPLPPRPVSTAVLPVIPPFKAESKTVTVDLPPVGDLPNADGTWLEQMDWVTGALGRVGEGRSVSRLDCPGPATWGLFLWAQSDEKVFRNIWAHANKKQSDGDGRDASAEVIKSVAEMEAMLDEIDAQVTAELRADHSKLLCEVLADGSISAADLESMAAEKRGEATAMAV
jgi:hypothetical protein